MKLFYIANARIPTEKAHGIQILKMSEVFGQALGFDNFCLVLPTRFGSEKTEKGTISPNVCRRYGLKTVFKTKQLPTIDLLQLTDRFRGLLDVLAYFIETISFGFSSLFFCLVSQPDAIYTRDFYLLPILLISGKPIYYETHYFPANFFAQFLHRLVFPHLAGLIAITHSFTDHFSRFNFQPKRFLVAHNGADLDFFAGIADKDKLARKDVLKIPRNAIVIGYIGRLAGAGEDKGKHVLLSALTTICQKNPQVRCLIVGEEAQNISAFARVVPRHLSRRFIFTGVVPYEQMPVYFSLLDIGLIPFPDRPHFRYFMSPLKVFDYLACGIPIVTSDFPSLREILTEKNAVFVKPGNQKHLASGITDLINNPVKRREMKLANRKLAQKYTWQKRARQILDFINLK